MGPRLAFAGWRWAAGMLLLGISAEAPAQVFRCEQHGKTVFSDLPCEAGAKASKKEYATVHGNAQVDFNVQLTHYDVRGQDKMSVFRSLDANGPKGFHGLASWKIDYKYSAGEDKGDCYVREIRTQVSGAILMPRWIDESSASPDLRVWWQTLYSRLMRHEEGHVQHGRELAQLINERLLGLGTQPCGQLPGLARQEFDRLVTNLKGRDKEYDARTNHGRIQFQ
jgi:predicted secreted Zn-dependent protease